MGFFHYKATDKSGKSAEGTIRAASADAARQALVQAGFQVSLLRDAASAGAIVAPARPAVAPVPRVSSPPPRPSRVEPAIPKAADPHLTVANPPAPIRHKTPFGRDKDLFFLFSQLSSYFRAGSNPQIALHTSASKVRSRYRESLLDAERAVTEGGSLSAALERYPYLYPPDVVGMVRAGEAAGFLPEACASVADVRILSHRLKRRLSYFIVMVFLAAVAFPVSYAAVTGALQSMRAQDQAGGSLPVADTIKAKIAHDLIHVAPIMLTVLALMTAFMVVWHTMPLRRVRHQLALATPILGGRARAEAIARLTWAMGMVSRGGLSPQATFTLAAESVPNLILRERYMEAARSMHEAERLSVAIKRSNALPVEYAHIVETGEVTGDVPRAISDISRATEADFQARDGSAARLMSFLLYFLIGAIVLGLVAILYRTYYGGIINIGLGSDQ